MIFIIIISGHVPVPLRDSQFELSRGKWSHFPLSKIRVQPARMILIIILIFAYYIIFQWKMPKTSLLNKSQIMKNFMKIHEIMVIKFYPGFNLDMTQNDQRGNNWYCTTVTKSRIPCLKLFTNETASITKMLRNVAVLLVSPEIDDIKISISYSSTSQEIQLIKICTSNACQYENAYFNMT